MSKQLPHRSSNPFASRSSIPEPLPPYTEVGTSLYASLSPEDPRSSSTQSLAPEEPAHDSRRKLLLIYIHGFMGSETSFGSFPAHVHNLTKVLLAESHAVHTKIYPRYRSRKAITFARDDFSKWLAPHESPETDVILLGHSMGGLLSAEIALKAPDNPSGNCAFQHRILGTINFDVPFLGMHPGVVSSGLASLFRSKESPERESRDSSESHLASPSSASLQSPSTATLESSNGTISPAGSYTAASPSQPSIRKNTLFSPSPSDPAFNPSFNNDVNLPIRKGWENTMHFLNKHSRNVLKAGQQAVKSHLEFGGAMADYPALKQRYARIVSLEDERESRRRSGQGGRISKTVPNVPRVRFVNYYTASSGRVKKEKSRSRSRQKEEVDRDTLSLEGPLSATSSRPWSRSPSPRISVEEHREDGVVEEKDLDLPHSPELAREQTRGTLDSESSFEIDETASIEGVPSAIPNMPPLPPVPIEPTPISLELYTDKDVRKAVQREHARAIKAYKQALKNHNRALKDRAKIEEKYKRRMEKADQRLKKSDEDKTESDSLKKQEAENQAAGNERVAKTTTKADLEAPSEEPAINASEYNTSPAPSSAEPSPLRTTGKHEGAYSGAEADAGLKVEDNDNEDAEAVAEEGEEAILARYRTAETELLSSRRSGPSPHPLPLTPTDTTTTATSSEHQPPHRRSRAPSPAQQQEAHCASAAAPTAPSPAPPKEKQPQPPPGEAAKKKEKKKDRKFCALPPKAADGSRDDRTWVRIYMRDVDEVGAHCGLFVQGGRNGPSYEVLVGDVGGRIEEWVREEMSRRVVEEEGGM